MVMNEWMITIYNTTITLMRFGSWHHIFHSSTCLFNKLHHWVGHLGAPISIPSLPWLHLVPFLRYSTCNNGIAFEISVRIIQGNWKWHHMIDCIQSSYCHFTATMAIFGIVSKTKQDTGWKSWFFPSEFPTNKLLAVEKRMFSCFQTIHKRDRQTDRLDTSCT